MSKDAPVSEDKRYRLERVAEDGSVELTFFPAPEVAVRMVVKPMPQRFAPGERFPTIVVVASNPETQTATIEELRFR